MVHPFQYDRYSAHHPLPPPNSFMSPVTITKPGLGTLTPNGARSISPRPGILAMVVLLWAIGAWTSLAWMKVKSGTAAPLSAPAQGARMASESSAANDQQL